MFINIYRILLPLILILLSTTKSSAFKNNAAYVGLGYYSQNAFYKTTQKDNGSTGLLGELSYPLNLSYEHSINFDWFVATQFSHTLIPRSSPIDTAKTTMSHLSFNFGKNFDGYGQSTWGWSIGPGVMMYEIKGAGGSKEMNNGTSTTTYALPGQTASIKKITINWGAAFNMDKSRLGFDLIFENFFSNKKRTQSMMFSYAYQFGGGF